MAEDARDARPVPGAVPLTGTRWAARYVGLPFLSGGRTRAAVDCWGLVRLVFADHAGIDLPSHDTVEAHDLLRVMGRVREAVLIPPWTTAVPIGAEQPLDVVVMSDRPGKALPTHVGVIVGPGSVLHAQEATLSTIMRLDAPALRGRVLGIYRHDALA